LTLRSKISKTGEKQAWPDSRPDITPGASVQNILKKVKKRLVSPLKRR
jgi:hypothetical protein